MAGCQVKCAIPLRGWFRDRAYGADICDCDIRLPSLMTSTDKMPITADQMSALRNLADKDAGSAVDFINIADARALTELGLARRTRAGWQITAAGAAAVGGSAAPETSEA